MKKNGIIVEVPRNVFSSHPMVLHGSSDVGHSAFSA